MSISPYQPGRPVLRGINFVAEPGQTVAIVGATGGGKSTLAGLAAKFYLPASGVVQLDGIEYQEDFRTLAAPASRDRAATEPLVWRQFVGEHPVGATGRFA